MIKRFAETLLNKTGSLFTKDIHKQLSHTASAQDAIRKIAIDRYLQEYLLLHPKYADPKKISKYQYQVYSQNGEDGMIQEIFHRVGTTNKFFVEFGVSNGLECNSLFLLLQGWKGCWMDGGKENILSIQKKFDFLIRENKLSALQAFITEENIEKLLHSQSVPKEFDFLSIDIDRNDYWVWAAIQNYSPRVIAIEYNSLFRPPVEFVVKYESDKTWNYTSHFGASLKSLELLGTQKGYQLVGCDFTGTNAFFVRKDLAGNKFCESFTAETHYEPPRYFLANKEGHPRDFGEFFLPAEKSV